MVTCPAKCLCGAGGYDLKGMMTPQQLARDEAFEVASDSGSESGPPVLE